MLVIALALGLVSVFLARGWLADQAKRSPTASNGVETTTVVVARRAITYGDEIHADYLTEMRWPSTAKPEGSFAKIAEIITEDGTKRVALRSIEANEPLLRNKVSGFGQKATLSAIIDSNKRAMTIRVNDVIGVGGFVLPGDRVDVLLTRDTGDRNFVTDVVLQNLKVLGVDQEANDAKDKPAVARAVTLEVSTPDGQRLVLASEVGTLSLALRNGAGDQDFVQTNTVHVRDLSRTVSPKAPVPPPGYTVNVIRATTATSSAVRTE
jgi:pilus assembly protein CpaB